MWGILIFMIDKEYLLKEKKRVEDEQVEVFKEIRDIAEDIINWYESKGYSEEFMGDADSQVLTCSCSFNQLYHQRSLICEYLGKI